MELINVRINPKRFSQYRRAYLVGREREYLLVYDPLCIIRRWAFRNVIEVQ